MRPCLRRAATCRSVARETVVAAWVAACATVRSAAAAARCTCRHSLVCRAVAAAIFDDPKKIKFVALDANERFTLSFYAPEHKEALRYLGTHSGRDSYKATHVGFTPAYLDGSVAFEQASLVLVCRKLYADDIKPEKGMRKLYATALELGPLLLFFAANSKWGIFIGTAVFVAATAICLPAYRWMEGRWPIMPMW